MRARLCGAMVVAVALLAGCGGDGNLMLPTSPTTIPAPTVPSPPPPIRGEITVAALEPPSGATLQVVDCDPTIPPDLARVTPKHYTGPCAIGFRAVVNVELEEELSNGRVTVEFRDGGGHLCAYSDSYSTSLPARTQTSVTFTELMLTDNAPNAAPLYCALPATTIEAVISVFGRGTPLRRQISYAYTFVKG